MEKIIMELNNIIKEQESILMRRHQENLHRILMQELVLRHTLRENLGVNTMDYILNQILDRSASFNQYETHPKESSLSSNSSSFETISDDNLFRKQSNNPFSNDSCSSSSIYTNGMDTVLSYIQNVSSSIAASCTKAAIQATLDNSLGLVLAASLPNLSFNDQSKMQSQCTQRSFEDIMGLIDHIGQMQSIHTLDKLQTTKAPSYLKKSTSSLMYNRQNSKTELKSLASALLKLLGSSSDNNLTESFRQQSTDSTISRFNSDTSNSDTTNSEQYTTESSFNNTSSLSSLYSSDTATFLFKCIIPQLIQVNGRIEIMEKELMNLYQERDILNTLKSLELNGNSYFTSSLLDRFDSKLKSLSSSEEYSFANSRTSSLEHIIPPWMMKSDASSKSFKDVKKDIHLIGTSNSMPIVNKVMAEGTMNHKNTDPVKTKPAINTTSRNTVKQPETTQPVFEMQKSDSFERQLSEITRLLAMLRLDSKDSIQSEESSLHLGFMNSNEWGSEELSALSSLANALKVKSDEFVCSLHHKKNRRARNCQRKRPKKNRKQNKNKRQMKKTGKAQINMKNDNIIEEESVVKEEAIVPSIFIPSPYKMITDGSVISDNKEELCIVGSGIKAEQPYLPRVYQQYFITPAGFTIRILRTDSVESEE